MASGARSSALIFCMYAVVATVLVAVGTVSAVSKGVCVLTVFPVARLGEMRKNVDATFNYLQVLIQLSVLIIMFLFHLILSLASLLHIWRSTSPLL